MYSVAETETFKAKANKLMDEQERLAFISFLAEHPLKGDVIPNGGGLRKIRWRKQGQGKSGGYRVIYFNMLENGLIVCVDIYSKNQQENLSNKQLQQLKGQTS